MNAFQNTWYAAAWSSELGAGASLARTIAGQAVVLYRSELGVAAALEDRCSHRCAPLSKGRVQGDGLRCWYHGLLFGPDGACRDMPGQEKVALGFDVRSFPVLERSGCIWMWTGAAALADPALLPETRIDEGGLDYRTGALEYAADYQLINDNLCDFSHVAYVHENTLAQGNDEWAQRRPTLENLSNGIRVTRWIEGARPLPLPGLPERVDLWMAYDYLVPGVLLMQIEYHPLGAANASHFEPPRSLEGVCYAMRTAQFATPVFEGRAHYLYAVSLPVSPGPEALDMTFAMTAHAFLEDKDIIEAQQAAIDRSPGVTLRNTAHDAALNRIRRMIQQRISQEIKAAAKQAVAAE